MTQLGSVSVALDRCSWSQIQVINATRAVAQSSVFHVAVCVQSERGSAALYPLLEPACCFLALTFSSSVPARLISGVKR